MHGGGREGLVRAFAPSACLALGTQRAGPRELGGVEAMMSTHSVASAEWDLELCKQ